MTRARRLVLLSALALAAAAATNAAAQYYAYQTPDACTTCKANVDFYGHYPTRWRPWPGESRMDIHFPQAIGAEEVQAPQGSPKPKVPLEKLEPLTPQRSPLLPGYSPANGGEDRGTAPPPPSPAVPEPPAASLQPPAVVPEPPGPATPFHTEPMPAPKPPVPLPNADEAPAAAPAVNPDSASQSMMLPLIVPPTSSASLAPRRGPVISVPPVDRFGASPTAASPPPASPTETAGWADEAGGGWADGAAGSNGAAPPRISLGASSGNAAGSPPPLVIRNPMVREGVPASAAGSNPAAGMVTRSTLGTEVPRREWLPEVKPGPGAFFNGSPSGQAVAPAAPTVAFQAEKGASAGMQRAGYVGLSIPETASPAGFESAVGPT
ncbi:MAG: hypothetical protein GYA33_07555, partial [Thermogutta sp.]|nr:hypothetical protein [Thermogutta sp.]